MIYFNNAIIVTSYDVCLHYVLNNVYDVIYVGDINYVEIQY